MIAHFLKRQNQINDNDLFYVEVISANRLLIISFAV